MHIGKHQGDFVYKKITQYIFYGCVHTRKDINSYMRTTHLFGHKCNHDLIDPHNNSYNNLDFSNVDKHAYTYHPFTDLGHENYFLCCKDFGADLRRTIYAPWEGIMNTPDSVERASTLWDILTGFDWDQIDIETRLNPKFQYCRVWYPRMFTHLYSLEEYREALSLLSTKPRWHNPDH